MARKSTMLWLALGIGAAWFLISRKASAATPGAAVPMPIPADATGTPAPVSIPPAVTAAQVQAGTTFWDTLNDASSSNPGTGYVLFPSGSMAAITFLPLATDTRGTLYTQWSGQVFSLGSANSDGNYPATLVG